MHNFAPHKLLCYINYCVTNAGLFTMKSILGVFDNGQCGGKLQRDKKES